MHEPLPPSVMLQLAQRGRFAAAADHVRLRRTLRRKDSISVHAFESGWNSTPCTDTSLTRATGSRKGSRRRRGGRGRKPRSAAVDSEAANGPGAAGSVVEGPAGGGRPGFRAARGSLQTYDNPAFADGNGDEAADAAEQVMKMTTHAAFCL